MYAHAHPNELTQAAPAGHRPQTSAGPLAEEAIYGRASHAARQPEAALMCAILEDAVESFQNQFLSVATRRAKRLGEEAEDWLFSDDAHWIFSFLVICAALDLSPQYIRQGLKCWRERGSNNRPTTISKLSNLTPKSTRGSTQIAATGAVSVSASKRFSCRLQLAHSQRKRATQKRPAPSASLRWVKPDSEESC